jgi:hypothetical protein
MSMPSEANPPSTSISKDVECLLDRMAKAEDRLQSIGDRLHGARPREGAALLNDAPASMRRHVDTAREIIGRIEAELVHIEERL